MLITLNIFKEGLYKFLLLLDQIVYSFVNYAYQVFITVSNGQVVSSDTVQQMSDRVNVIIGIVMLFLVSFSLLRSLSNPDELTKGEKSTAKLITNILIVLIMLTLTSTSFKFAYKVQNILLSEGIIGRIIIGSDSDVSSSTTIDAGFNMAVDVFSSFLNETNENTAYSIDLKGCTPITQPTGLGGYKLPEIISISKECKTLKYFKQLADPLAEDTSTLEYNFIISTVAGAFVLYIMVSFCIDLGVRAAKLAFYQLIAPIPILSRIIPGQKKIYDKWFQSVVSTFMDVFIKIAIISFAVFLISEVVPDIISTLFSSSNTGASFGVSGFSKVFLILGILMFAKEAPKLIGDLFGFDGSKMGLGIKKKLSEGLPPVPGAVKGAVGGLAAGVGAASRNAYSAIKNRKDGEKGSKTAFNAIKSGLGGFGGGAYRGYNASKSAKDLKEMKAGISKSADEAQLKHDERAEAGGFFKATGSSIKNSAKRTGQFFTGETASAKNKKAENLERVSNAAKEITTILDDTQDVKAVNAFYEQLKKEKASSPLDYSRHYNDSDRNEITAMQMGINQLKNSGYGSEYISSAEREMETRMNEINSSHEMQARQARTEDMVKLEKEHTAAKKEARVKAAVDKKSDVKFIAAADKLSESVDKNKAVVVESGVTNADALVTDLKNISSKTDDQIKDIVTNVASVTKKTGDKAFEYKTEAIKDEKKNT